LLRPPPCPALFPYTTLFRSLIGFSEAALAIEAKSDQAVPLADLLKGGVKRSLLYTGIIAGASASDISLPMLSLFMLDVKPLPARSEEHTSELQSRENLVCRL